MDLRMAPEAVFHQHLAVYDVRKSEGSTNENAYGVNITGLNKMESISHARMSRTVKPVLVPSTVESTKQKVEGTLSDEVNRCENQFDISSSSV